MYLSIIKKIVEFFTKFGKYKKQTESFPDTAEDLYAKLERNLFSHKRNYSNLRNLITSFNKRDFISFTGAGTSIFTGIKDWNDCIDESIEELKNKYSVALQINRDGLAWQQRAFSAIIAAYEQKTGSAKTFYDTIANMFTPKTTHYSGYHDNIIELVRTHLTTNFDLVLEERIRSKHHEVITQCIPHLDNAIINNKETVIYLHGNIKNNVFVLPKEVYDHYYPCVSGSGLKVIENFLYYIYHKKHVLFFGFSFNDYYLERCLEHISSEYKRNMLTEPNFIAAQNQRIDPLSKVQHFLIIDANNLGDIHVDMAQQRDREIERKVLEQKEEKINRFFDRFEAIKIYPVIFQDKNYIFIEDLINYLNRDK